MKIGVPKESNDYRVALVPATIEKLKALGLEILIEKDAGLAASFPDEAYQNLATIVDRETLLKSADLLASIHPLGADERAKLQKECIMVSLFQSYVDPSIIGTLRGEGRMAFSMDMIPRTTLAQSMDVLSSMASVAGYRAVLTACMHLPRYFPMMITAAGSIRPAKVLILGAGVAGLQAIATARRLGAMVEASDVRTAAKEEVESLGAKFVEVEGATDDTSAGGYAVKQSAEFLKRQQEEVQRRAAKADVVITTAQVRGSKAPVLLPKTTVDQMKPGSVIVDLAASQGGNCELTQDNAVIQHNGVTIVGDSNLPAGMPQDASLLFGNNLLNFLKLIVADGALKIDLAHEIVGSACITATEEEKAAAAETATAS
ncbi:MAG: NAD(P) transhydrogenase subunit alpha [Bacteroidota bacterium]